MDDTCILLSKRSLTQKTTFCLISFITFWKMQNYRKRKCINACQELRESRVVDERGTEQVYCLGGGIVLYSIVLVHIQLCICQKLWKYTSKREFYCMHLKKNNQPGCVGGCRDGIQTVRNESNYIRNV